MTPRCHDCDAAIGELHIPGCDTERCPRCFGQAIACPCVYEVSGLDYQNLEQEHPDLWVDGPTQEMWDRFEAEWGAKREPWSGLTPGVMECRELGLWALFGPDMDPPQQGWVPVPAGTPGASEDLNSLALLGPRRMKELLAKARTGRY